MPATWTRVIGCVKHRISQGFEAEQAFFIIHVLLLVPHGLPHTFRSAAIMHRTLLCRLKEGTAIHSPAT
eukprot:191045-Chlamydomonas_euryale.AAC.1